MLDWLGVMFVRQTSSECDHVEALHCERRALEKKISLACVMRDYYYYYYYKQLCNMDSWTIS